MMTGLAFAAGPALAQSAPPAPLAVGPLERDLPALVEMF